MSFSQFDRATALVLSLAVQRSSDGGAGGGGRGRGASPRRSIYREAVSRRAGDVHADNSSAFVNRVLRRVRLNSPAAQRLASRRPSDKGL